MWKVHQLCDPVVLPMLEPRLCDFDIYVFSRLFSLLHRFYGSPAPVGNAPAHLTPHAPAVSTPAAQPPAGS